jgi:hypothetical protein
MSQIASTVVINGWSGYKPLKDGDYVHDVKNISDSKYEAHELLPHVHLLDSLGERWLNGTYQGKVLPKYLHYYLDE